MAEDEEEEEEVRREGGGSELTRLHRCTSSSGAEKKGSD
jgi:hypothetical protein